MMNCTAYTKLLLMQMMYLFRYIAKGIIYYKPLDKKNFNICLTLVRNNETNWNFAIEGFKLFQFITSESLVETAS